MKRFLLLFSISGAILCAADLASVRTVYMLPMSKGLDQYLANRLTGGGVFQVVTNPAQADAIFCDRIGEALEQKLDEILPAPPKPEASKQEAPKPEAPGKEAKKPEEKKAEPAPAAGKTDAKPAAPAPPDMTRGDVAAMTDPSNRLANVASSFGRAKGTYFLVDTKSRAVVWSVYEKPRDNTSKQMDRTASDIVKRLKRDLSRK